MYFTPDSHFRQKAQNLRIFSPCRKVDIYLLSNYIVIIMLDLVKNYIGGTNGNREYYLQF